MRITSTPNGTSPSDSNDSPCAKPHPIVQLSPSFLVVESFKTRTILNHLRETLEHSSHNSTQLRFWFTANRIERYHTILQFLLNWSHTQIQFWLQTWWRWWTCVESNLWCKFSLNLYPKCFLIFHTSFLYVTMTQHIAI